MSPGPATSLWDHSLGSKALPLPPGPLVPTLRAISYHDVRFIHNEVSFQGFHQFNLQTPCRTKWIFLPCLKRKIKTTTKKTTQLSGFLGMILKPSKENNGSPQWSCNGRICNWLVLLMRLKNAMKIRDQSAK